ncbi:MAG: hypothetical protein M1813_001965 [Trichoglossum hirsutum]|nr:MAG: hypothetical protein M1813_001965 [Trichoglossum hirsutum]
MESQDPPIFRPIPRRTFEVTPASTDSSSSPTPNLDANPYFLDPKPNNEATPSRSRSILNLTSSTLFGIYSSPSGGFGDREEASTTWGTGAGMASPRQSWEGARPISKERIPQRMTPYYGNQPGLKNFILPLVLRTILLFVFGIAYGVIVKHLHDNHHVAPVRVEGIERFGWSYLIIWGVAGVALGSLLPWVDFIWEDKLRWGETMDTKEKGSNTGGNEDTSERTSKTGNSLAADWNPAVRSVGAFVGIAFAIVSVAYAYYSSSINVAQTNRDHPLQRKLPWQSTLQVSLTLAMVNPVLWYLIDRSIAGFLLSSVIGITGTALLLGTNPKIVPAPAAGSSNASMGVGNSPWPVNAGLISAESIGVATWIASVLFCSCVCFGNIGRRLAIRGGRAAGLP